MFDSLDDQMKHDRREQKTRKAWCAQLAVIFVVAIVVFVALWLVSLPLWLIGVGVIVPFVAAAYLNQRLFRYDAIAEHASAGEMAILFRQERSGWWGLGVLTGLVQFVPLLNLLGPVFAALAFIHFGLACLDRRRSDSIG